MAECWLLAKKLLALTLKNEEKKWYAGFDPPPHWFETGRHEVFFVSSHLGSIF